ncbi:unnamed protein product, partial [Discosporangium mesarthrocarpum]
MGRPPPLEQGMDSKLKDVALDIGSARGNPFVMVEQQQQQLAREDVGGPSRATNFNPFGSCSSSMAVPPPHPRENASAHRRSSSLSTLGTSSPFGHAPPTLVRTPSQDLGDLLSRRPLTTSAPLPPVGGGVVLEGKKFLKGPPALPPKLPRDPFANFVQPTPSSTSMAPADGGGLWENRRETASPGGQGLLGGSGSGREEAGAEAGERARGGDGSSLGEVDPMSALVPFSPPGAAPSGPAPPPTVQVPFGEDPFASLPGTSGGGSLAPCPKMDSSLLPVSSLERALVPFGVPPSDGVPVAASHDPFTNIDLFGSGSGSPTSPGPPPPQPLPPADPFGATPATPAVPTPACGLVGVRARGGGVVGTGGGLAGMAPTGSQAMTGGGDGRGSVAAAGARLGVVGVAVSQPPPSDMFQGSSPVPVLQAMRPSPPPMLGSSPLSPFSVSPVSQLPAQSGHQEHQQSHPGLRTTPLSPMKGFAPSAGMGATLARSPFKMGPGAGTGMTVAGTGMTVRQQGADPFAAVDGGGERIFGQGAGTSAGVGTGSGNPFASSPSMESYNPFDDANVKAVVPSLGLTQQRGIAGGAL